MSNAPSGSRPGYFQHVTQAVDALHQELVTSVWISTLIRS